jgi:acetolactate synthase small subunit
MIRHLAMIKVAATHEARSHVLALASFFRARMVDVAPESSTIEITGAEDKIGGLLEVLRPTAFWRLARSAASYGVLEMVANRNCGDAARQVFRHWLASGQRYCG